MGNKDLTEMKRWCFGRFACEHGRMDELVLWSCFANTWQGA